MKLIYSLLILILCAGCDPEYSVEYEIENATSGAVYIYSKPIFQEQSDTNRISDQTRLMLLSEFGIGRTTEKYLDHLESLPFENLLITNAEAKSFNRDVFDLNEWLIFYPEKGQGTGRVLLQVRERDFD
jgi:hypothetical protein